MLSTKFINISKANIPGFGGFISFLLQKYIRYLLSFINLSTLQATI